MLFIAILYSSIISLDLVDTFLVIGLSSIPLSDSLQQILFRGILKLHDDLCFLCFETTSVFKETLNTEEKPMLLTVPISLLFDSLVFVFVFLAHD